MLHPIWTLLLLGVAFVYSNKGDYATSTRDIASLLHLEDELIGYLRQYAQELQLKVNRMRKVEKEWKARRGHMQKDPASFVANPLISFPLMLRMHFDAPKWLDLGRQDIKKGSLQELVDRDLTGIKDIDLQDAIRGLLRVKDVYSLDEREMANGKLYGKQYDSRLSAADCLAVGTHLDDLKHGSQACKWLNISLDQYEEHMEPVYKILETRRFNIWEKMGNILINMDDLQGGQAAFKKSLQYASQDDNTWLARHLSDNLAHIAVHVDNCRGRNLLPAKSFLRCRYFTEGSPFLRLAPFKFEQLSIEPFIGLYHDVISPAEQENLINLTRSRLKDRGTQDNFVEAAVETNASGHVERLHRRIEDMTGLELGGSEPLMVSNFGIGGQHFIHLDCQQPKEFVEPYAKEYRAATALFYLTEVQIGGNASFPDLGFGIKPSRGSALVWHNTDNSGNCDIRSLQATCPVLLGTLSVATKWISGSGQWRRKPCRK